MPDRYDLVILGPGAGGLEAAELAAAMGLHVAAVEHDHVGGGSWTDSMASTALAASARAANRLRHADRYGLPAVEPHLDLAGIWRHIRAVQDELTRSDAGSARLAELGVELVRGDARVTGPTAVTVGRRVLHTRYVLVCAGTRPLTLDRPGLGPTDTLTTDSLFELDRPPASLVIVGGGPAGVELAQALARLGVAATLLQRGPQLLPRDEPALVARLTERLRTEGVAVHLDAEAREATSAVDHRIIHAAVRGHEQHFVADAVLVAVGRQPTFEGLGLAELGIASGPAGVEVDERGRTSERTIYIAGGSGHHLVHRAAHEAVQAVRDAFFPGRGRRSDVVPWCTFTDPELAHVGMTVAEAEARFGEHVDVWQVDLAHNDRARTEGEADGAMVVVTAKGRIVGAHLLAPAAGELIHELALAVEQRRKLADLAALVHVRPTLSASIGQLATEAMLERAQKLRWLVRRDKAGDERKGP